MVDPAIGARLVLWSEDVGLNHEVFHKAENIALVIRFSPLWRIRHENLQMYGPVVTDGRIYL